MPKLPGPQDIRKTAIGGPRARLNAQGAALAAPSRALQGLGKAIGGMGSDMQAGMEKAEREDYAHLTADAENRRYGTETDYDINPDWQGREQGYNESTAKIRDETADKIKNPKLKQQFLDDFNGRVRHGGIRIRGGMRKIQASNIYDSMASRLEKSRARLMDPDITDEQRSEEIAMQRKFAAQSHTQMPDLLTRGKVGELVDNYYRGHATDRINALVKAGRFDDARKVYEDAQNPAALWEDAQMPAATSSPALMGWKASDNADPATGDAMSLFMSKGLDPQQAAALAAAGATEVDQNVIAQMKRAKSSDSALTLASMIMKFDGHDKTTSAGYRAAYKQMRSILDNGKPQQAIKQAGLFSKNEGRGIEKLIGDQEKRVNMRHRADFVGPGGSWELRLKELRESGEASPVDHVIENRIMKPEKLHEQRGKEKAAKAYYQATNGLDISTSNELATRVEDLREAAKDKSDKYHRIRQYMADEAGRAEDAIIATRRIDPASSVGRFSSGKGRDKLSFNGFDEVNEAEITARREPTPKNMQALAGARIIAQIEIGIPNPQPVTNLEAEKYFQSTVTKIWKDPDNADNHLKALVGSIEADYGPYADEVLDRVMMQMKVRDDVRAEFSDLIRKMKKAWGSTDDIARMRETYEMDQADEAMRIEAESVLKQNPPVIGADEDMVVRGEFEQIDKTEANTPAPPIPAQIQILKDNAGNKKFLSLFDRKFGQPGLAKELLNNDNQ